MASKTGRLGGLEAVGTDLDPDLGAELLVPRPGTSGSSSSTIGEADGVGETLQWPVIIEPGDDQDEHRERRARSRSAAGGRR